MLRKIIIEGELGVVIGESESGEKSLSDILTMHPDVVVLDLLMPELDGIETMEQLKKEGFQGQFIMISQVANKEMVEEAYEKGIEFFIHKPINRVEVQSILTKTAEQLRLKDSLLAIRESLAHIGSFEKITKRQSVREVVLSILNDMGIIGEVGSSDIVRMMEILIYNQNKSAQLPPLKDLYEALAHKSEAVDINKECKAIEQRVRRTLLIAINYLASLGTIDYTHSKFEYYAPRYFDFQEIRSRMKQIQEVGEESAKIKINNKKFLQALYLETLDKM